MTDVHSILKTATAPAADRAERFAKRLDAHLETLPDGQRAGFLDREVAKWRENYRTWARRIDTGTASETELTYSAWDFTLTIAEVERRRAEYGVAA